MNRTFVIIAAAMSLCLIVISSVRAGDIINDSFAGGKGAAISGRSPDTANLPGSKWTVAAFNLGGGFQASIDTGGENPAPRAYLACGGNSTGAIAIPLASHGSYVKPPLLHISASLQGANPSLGFYSVLPVQDPNGAADVFLNFTGLRLGASGDLALYRKGVFVAHVPYTGTFDPKAFHTLSYDIDTRQGSGAVYNVMLEGSTSDYTALAIRDVVAGEDTNYAAVAALCESGRDNLAYADNFVVSAGRPASSDPVAQLRLKGTVASLILIRYDDKIGFMGDSITAQGNSPKGYVRLVIAGLKLAGIEATAVPAGHTGDTSGNMLQRTNPDVLHKGVDWMTISCGVNDVVAPEKTPGASLEAFKKNVAGMVAKAKGWNVRVILLTPTPRGENLEGESNPKLAAYVDFMRSFAKENNIPLADINAAFHDYLNRKPPQGSNETPGKRLLADGIHPNEAGQFLMAMTLLETMGIPKDQLPKIEQELRTSLKK
jgi:lysophospholipase L1-like esterase